MKSTYARAMTGGRANAEPIKNRGVYATIAVLILGTGAFAPREALGFVTHPVGIAAMAAILAGLLVRTSMALTPWAFVSAAVVLYGLGLTQTPVAGVSSSIQLVPLAIAVTVGIFQLRVKLVTGAAALHPARARWGSTIVAITAAIVVVGLGFPSAPLVTFLTQGGDHTADSSLLPTAYASATVVGRVQDASLTEISGVAASRSIEGAYWVHNDSGNPAFLYCLELSGLSCGVWDVQGAENLDWEDIAVGPGPAEGATSLYIGDIGDNALSRQGVTVYRIPEPGARSTSSTRSPAATAPAEAIELRYPDGPHDAEVLLVHPVTGDIYIVTKEAVSGVYRATAPFDGTGPRTLERVGRFSIFATLAARTGGSISPDGRRIALATYGGGFELTLPARVSMSGFDAIWDQTPAPVDAGRAGQREAITYSADGRSIVTMTEGSRTPIYRTDPQQPGGKDD